MSITALSDISGLVLDIDPHLTAFTDTSGTTAATDGQAVARVNDQTIGAYHAIQAGSNKPTRATDINGWHYLSFDGADDCLYGSLGTFAPSQPFSVVSVVNLYSSATGNQIWQDATSNHVMLKWESAGPRWNLRAGADNRINATYPVGIAVLIGIVNGASSILAVNGSDLGTGNSGTDVWAAGYILFARATGGASATKGFLYRHATYSKVLSTTERADIYNLLSTKYANSSSSGSLYSNSVSQSFDLSNQSHGLFDAIGHVSNIFDLDNSNQSSLDLIGGVNQNFNLDNSNQSSLDLIGGVNQSFNLANEESGLMDFEASISVEAALSQRMSGGANSLASILYYYQRMNRRKR